MDFLLLGLGVFLALVASGAVRTAESALSSISRARVEEMQKNEVSGAVSLMRVLGNRATHINLLVLLQTVLDASAAVLAGAIALRFIPERGWALVAAIAVISLVAFVVVGVYARTVGRQNPYTVLLNSARVLSVLATVLGPLTKLLIWVGNKITPGPVFRDGPYSTEVELREMVDVAQEHGIVEVEERRMIQSVFDLASTTARSVMVPRPEMVWIEAEKNAGQATALCVRSGHSRIPVIGENVDDIVGVIYLKDLVQETYTNTDGGRSVLVKDVMREPTFVPDSTNLDDLLNKMQVNRNHIALLVDEYGGIAGLISIEDILEEIVGEIADEYDTSEVAPIERLPEEPKPSTTPEGAASGSTRGFARPASQLEGDDAAGTDDAAAQRNHNANPSRRYRVVSRLSLEDLQDLIDEDLGEDLEFSEETTDQVDTVGGLLAYELGRVPLPGATVTSHGLTLTAEGAPDRRGRMKMRSVVVEVGDLRAARVQRDSAGDDQERRSDAAAEHNEGQ